MTITYQFGKLNRTHIISKQYQALSLIKSFFSKYNAISGKPLLTVKTNKVIVQVFYYTVNNTINNFNINALSNALTQCWDQPIELRLIRLNHVVLDSTIFAQYLSLNSNKYSFNRLFDMLQSNLSTVVSEEFESSAHGNTKEVDLTSHVTGVKIKLSGRLTTQHSGPRQTIKASRLGSSAKGKHSITDFSQFTSKNKLGAFTIKVWINQKNT